MKNLVMAISLVPAISIAQSFKQDSIWMPLIPLIGKWTGKSEGVPGNGRYERSYERVLNDKFVEVRNKSVYPPTNGKHEEVHEDRGYISYDRIRRIFVLRQFHIEGFVNQYKLESISADKKTLVFVSESIENIPAGFRARETYQINSNDEFIETFELAEPGKDFELYSRAVLKRVK